jgi:hypothetical protein
VDRDGERAIDVSATMPDADFLAPH